MAIYYSVQKIVNKQKLYGNNKNKVPCIFSQDE